MAARKKGKNINLLPQEEFASSAMGRALAWALSTFRIIVIITEVVVMGAFLSRFWLDARVSDLNDEIAQNRAVIEASAEFEEDFKSAQQRLGIFSALASDEDTASSTLDAIISYIPDNIILTSYGFLQDRATVKGVTSSERAIAQFIANLDSDERFGEITITQLGASEDQASQLLFTLEIQLEGGS
jgi:Tfp pilus assembly protein PilN